MKSSTIKLALNAKISEFLETIEDEHVRSVAASNIMVCGGAIASMLANEKVNDYDIYFKSFDAVKTIAEYYCKVFNETQGDLKTKVYRSHNPEVRVEMRENIRGEQEERVIIWMQSSGVAAEEAGEYAYFEQQSELSADQFVETLGQDYISLGEDMAQAVNTTKAKKKFRPVFFTDNAITLSDKVQLVLRFHGNIEEIHKNYDYAHAMCGYDYSNNHLQLHQEALESILGRNLVYQGSLYPIASLFRIRKFLKRGWSITAGQMLKIIWQVNELDLSNPKVLKEQLLGVDQAYMLQLISLVNNREPGVRVDSTYIAKIVDQVFD